MQEIEVLPHEIDNLIEYYKEFKALHDNGFTINIASLLKKHNMGGYINSLLKRSGVISIKGVGINAKYTFNCDVLDRKSARHIIYARKNNTKYNYHCRVPNEKNNTITEIIAYIDVVFSHSDNHKATAKEVANYLNDYYDTIFTDVAVGRALSQSGYEKSNRGVSKVYMIETKYGNPIQKIKDRDNLILQFHKDGRSLREIADDVSLSHTAVSKIIKKNNHDSIQSEKPIKTITLNKKDGYPIIKETIKEISVFGLPLFRRRIVETLSPTQIPPNSSLTNK